MNKKIKIIFSVSLFIIILVIIGYFIVLKFRNTPSNLVEITISPKWVNQTQFAGIFVAQERGFYKKRGLSVKVKEYSYDTKPIVDVMTGKSQLALTSPAEFLDAKSKGNDITAMAAFFQVSPFAVVSLSQQNITSPREFGGKTLGIKGGEGAEGQAAYELLLASAGLKQSQVKIKFLDFSQTELNDLKQEKADVINLYRTDQLYLFDQEKTPYNVIYPERYGASTYNDILFSKEDFVKQNPEIVRNFILATREGWEYTIKNPDDALDITMKQTTQESYKNRDYQKYILENSLKLIKPKQDTVIGQMEYSPWKDLHDIMLNRKLLNTSIDLNEVLNLKLSN